jgi:hypothetical protein
MRNLIKKLLKEYFNPEIKIEVAGWCSDELLEELIKNSNLISEQDRIWYIQPTEWKNAVNEIENYINDNFPIETSFIDVKNKKNPIEKHGGIKNVFVSNHYYYRLFRSKDPDYRPGGRYYNPKLVDPNPLEGVILIHNHASEILKAIMSQPQNRRANLRLVISKNNNPIYTIVVAPDYQSTIINRIPYFNIGLVTQIKGDNLRDDEVNSNNQKKVKLR